jgi:hypothetical protein
MVAHVNDFQEEVEWCIDSSSYLHDIPDDFTITMKGTIHKAHHRMAAALRKFNVKIVPSLQKLKRHIKKDPMMMVPGQGMDISSRGHGEYLMDHGKSHDDSSGGGDELGGASDEGVETSSSDEGEEASYS